MRFNLPTVTSEVRGTDRVALMPWSLMGPLTGSPVPPPEPPSVAVTWRQVPPEFAALVRRFDSKSLNAWAYSFADTPSKPLAHFWRLQPGRYELIAGPDANGDGKIDGIPQQKIPFEVRQRTDGVQFGLPAKTLTLVEVRQVECYPKPAARLPDLAVMPRDIHLAAAPVVGKPCQGTVVAHNIGSAPATDICVEVLFAPKQGHKAPAPVKRFRIPRLHWPEDLRPKTTSVSFEWVPTSAGKHVIQATITAEHKITEIYAGNNRAQRLVTVKK
jgi:hypothetical protein